MNKMYLFLLCLVLGPGSVFASPVPGIDAESPEFLPPPIEGDFPVQPVAHKTPPLEFNSEEDILDEISNLSGVAYYSVLRDWGLLPPKSEPYQTPQPHEGIQSASIDPSVVGTVPMVNDSYEDKEPTVIAVTKDGVDYTTTAYIKFIDESTPRNYFSTTTDFATFHRGQLSMPSGYGRSGDPLAALNPFTYGIAPGRMYVTGIVFNINPDPYHYGLPNGIAVWRSDNGGISWSYPTISAVNNNDDLQFLDKPAIAVSWHYGTKGYVYVAYMKINNSQTDQLLVTRSTDGGVTFEAPVLVAEGEDIQGPQILVDKSYGYVYVLWVEAPLNSLGGIHMSTSYDRGQHWTGPETPPEATGYMVRGAQKDWLNGDIRAGTLPMARFNWVANRIGVVWHEKESIHSNLTDVYFQAKGPSGWLSHKVRINDVQTNDQFMPALDFDASGRFKVTFYDRRDDPYNIKYHVYIAHIDSTGNLLGPNGRISEFQSDPEKYCHPFEHFIGDYQDIWAQQYSFGEYYISTWAGIPNNVGDIYITAILP